MPWYSNGKDRSSTSTDLRLREHHLAVYEKMASKFYTLFIYLLISRT